MSTYVTKSGDTWDSIAFEATEDETQAELLIAANPSQAGTYIFPAGTELTLPEWNSMETDISSYPPWRR